MSTEPRKNSDETAEGSRSTTSARTRRSSRRWPLFVVLLALGSAGGYYWYQTRDVGPQDRPLIVAVEIGDVENMVVSSGNLEPRHVLAVGAQVSGQLQRLFVDIGDDVEAGDLLAEIDARVQENRVRASRASIDGQYAQIEARESALALARTNAARQTQLRAERATSQAEYDSAMNNLINAEASLTQLMKQIEQSEASLASDETQLEYTRIMAPISGTVVAVEMNEGVTLNASQSAPTVLRLADLSTMRVETRVSEADISELYIGMEVYFTTLGGGSRRWTSTLHQILPTARVENNVVMYTALFDVDNQDGALLPGMTTQVHFVTSAARNVVTVPIGALSFDDGGPSPMSAAGGMGRPDMGDFNDPAVRAQMLDQIAARTGQSRAEIEQRMASMGGAFPGGAAGGGGARAQGGGQGGGNFAQQGNARGGADRTAARPAGEPGAPPQPRRATVQVALGDDQFETREVMIGLMSRVSAEVLSGLAPGEYVVAGIIQGGSTQANQQQGNQNNRQQQGGFPGGGFPGGFPGGGLPGGFRGF